MMMLRLCGFLAVLIDISLSLDVAWEVPVSSQAVEISKGESIDFRFASGHDIYLMENQDKFDSCDFSGAILLSEDGPYAYLTSQKDVGEIFFACKVASHCSSGQKLRVTVKEPPIPAEALIAYKAILTPLDPEGTASGELYVLATGDAEYGRVAFTGRLTGLTANLDSRDCRNPANACGIHIHSGTSCADASSQGAHYYLGSDIESRNDPWSDVQYSPQDGADAGTSGAGTALVFGDIEIWTNKIEGKVVILHDDTGARVACGLLAEVPSYIASIKPSNDYQASGTTGGAFAAVATTQGDVLIAGTATGLGRDLIANPSTCTDLSNACGVHVHNGTSCDSTEAQGAHYYAATLDDPWREISHQGFDDSGSARLVAVARAGTPEIELKPVVVHDQAGTRVGCGVLVRGGAPDRTTNFGLRTAQLSLATFVLAFAITAVMTVY